MAESSSSLLIRQIWVECKLDESNINEFNSVKFELFKWYFESSKYKILNPFDLKHKTIYLAYFKILNQI